MSLAEKFNIPPALFDTIKKMNEGREEYQAKVKALMAKKGIKSLADLSPEEKKEFFNTLDSMHKAKNEEVELDEAIPKSTGYALVHSSSKKIVAKGNKEEMMKKMKEANAKEKGSHHLGMTHRGKVGDTFGEEVELEEAKSGTGYNLYHKDFSSAMAHAYDFAKQKYNIEIDPTEIDRNVAMGPKKPSSGKANAYRLLDKTGKKAIQVQVTNLDNKRYELNMYKEDLDLEEKFSPAQIDKMRQEYDKIKTINPDSDNYKKLISMLDKLDTKTLESLADAKIKFVSGLARNRIRRKTNEEVELDEMDKSQPSSSRGAEGLPLGKKAEPVKTDKVRQDALKALQKQYKKEEVELDESHFKLGQKVECLKSGMEGKVVKIDKPEEGKYYTVKREDGKEVKYAPDELKALKEETTPPFSPDKNKKQIATPGKSGYGSSAAKHLAQMALKKQQEKKKANEEVEIENEMINEDLMKLDPVTNTLVGLAVAAGVAMYAFDFWFGKDKDMRKPIEKGMDKAEKEGNAKLYHSLAAKYYEDKVTKYTKALDKLRTNPNAFYKKDSLKTGAKKGEMKKFEKRAEEELLRVLEIAKKKQKEFEAKEKSGEPISKAYYESTQRKQEDSNVEELRDPKTSMKRAALSVARAKEVGRHQKEIGNIRKKREALRASFDAEEIDEQEKKKVLWPGTPEYKKKFPKESKPGQRHKKQDYGYRGKSGAEDEEDTKKESVEITEISKKLALSYLSQAPASAAAAGNVYGNQDMSKEKKDRAWARMRSRSAGGANAAARVSGVRKTNEKIELTQEEIDFINELNKKEATAADNKKMQKKGEKLSGKQEPVEIHPELKEQKS